MRDISTIVGLEVIGVADGKVIGRVSEVVCDLATGRVVGLITGEGAAEKGIAAEDIVTIGEDAVMVPSADVAKRLSEMEELMRFRRPEGKPIEVVTDDGRRIGRVARIWIDPYRKVVTRYEVSRGVVQDLTEGRVMLPIIEGTVHGEDTIIVPAAQAIQLAGQAGGLRDALRKLSQKVKEQSAAAREKAEEAAKAARERLQEAVEAAKEAAEKVAEKKEGAQSAEQPAGTGEAPAEAATSETEEAPPATAEDTEQAPEAEASAGDDEAESAEAADEEPPQAQPTESTPAAVAEDIEMESTPEPSDQPGPETTLALGPGDTEQEGQGEDEKESDEGGEEQSQSWL